jgi:hypothetical protein
MRRATKPACEGDPLSLKELESAVSHLAGDELAEFAQWFEEYLADVWDKRIEADILAGKLEEAGRRADEEFEAGGCNMVQPIELKGCSR